MKTTATRIEVTSTTENLCSIYKSIAQLLDEFSAAIPAKIYGEDKQNSCLFKEFDESKSNLFSDMRSLIVSIADINLAASQGASI